jgi:cobalt-zinc-cadmium resistance protein CzcA
MVLVSAIREKWANGVPALKGVVDASVECLRTVLMTSLVASVGFLPMAVSTGMGGEVQRPLATVVIGGIVTSMFMTLFILPVLCLVVKNLSRPRKDIAGEQSTGGSNADQSEIGELVAS